MLGLPVKCHKLVSARFSAAISRFKRIPQNEEWNDTNEHLLFSSSARLAVTDILSSCPQLHNPRAHKPSALTATSAAQAGLRWRGGAWERRAGTSQSAYPSVVTDREELPAAFQQNLPGAGETQQFSGKHTIAGCCASQSAVYSGVAAVSCHDSARMRGRFPLREHMAQMVK